MTIRLNNTGKNHLLNGTWDPSTITAALFTGSDYENDEVTGGDYSRLSVTFDAAAGGSLTQDSESPAPFDAPAATTITHGALFMGAERVAEGAVTNESFTQAGVYNLNGVVLTIPDL